MKKYKVNGKIVVADSLREAIVKYRKFNDAQKTASEISEGDIITREDGSKWRVTAVRKNFLGVQIRMNSISTPVKTDEITYRPNDRITLDSVKDMTAEDSAASNIVREIKAAYPDVHIRQTAKQYADKFLTTLEFSNYPGERDHDTTKQNNWQSFLKHLVKRYIPEADYRTASVYSHNMMFVDSADSVKDEDYESLISKYTSDPETTLTVMGRTQRVDLSETDERNTKLINALKNAGFQQKNSYLFVKDSSDSVNDELKPFPNYPAISSISPVIINSNIDHANEALEHGDVQMATKYLNAAKDYWDRFYRELNVFQAFTDKYFDAMTSAKIEIDKLKSRVR